MFITFLWYTEAVIMGKNKFYINVFEKIIHFVLELSTILVRQRKMQSFFFTASRMHLYLNPLRELTTFSENVIK